MTREPSIFISHKHSDRKIATELREFIQRTSLGEVSVFQSSDPLAEGPRLGQPLNQELKEALWKVGVVLLIYTTEDQDWSYCMWECGVATNPESPQTKIIVLQCGADTPKVFQNEVRVDVRDPDAVYNFVQNYLTSTEFFPSVNKAVAPKFSPDGPPVREAARDLHSRLIKIIPKREVAEWSPQPFVRLELKTEDLASVTAGADLTQFSKLVRVHEIDPHASHIFGISKCERDASFDVLVQNWLERRKVKSAGWIEDLQVQLQRASRGEVPDPRWTQLPEADGPERYTPVLTRIRQVSTPEAMQFDVSLIPFEPSKVLTGIGDPYLDEYRLAMCKIESSAQSLAPYFTPIAARFFNDWSEYVKKVLTRDGELMHGPERLEITRKLVLATKKHMLIERVVANPLTKKHSRDWLAFYEDIGGRAEIEKVWMLCVDEKEATLKATDVEAAWKFFSDRKFKTLFCDPSDVELAIGEAVPTDDVIEVFGEFEFLKILSLPGGSYTADPSKNVLVTSFRVTGPEDRRLLQSMNGCSTPMSENWLRSLRREDKILS